VNFSCEIERDRTACQAAAATTAPTAADPRPHQLHALTPASPASAHSMPLSTAPRAGGDREPRVVAAEVDHAVGDEPDDEAGGNPTEDDEEKHCDLPVGGPPALGAGGGGDGFGTHVPRRRVRFGRTRGGAMESAEG